MNLYIKILYDQIKTGFDLNKCRLNWETDRIYIYELNQSDYIW